jgi:hypothetical protein
MDNSKPIDTVREGILEIPVHVNGDDILGPQPSEPWPSLSNETVASAVVARAPARKRRFYADYRELLCLESKAKKLNFLAPVSANARVSLPEQLIQTPVRAPVLEANGNGVTAEEIAAARSDRVEARVFSPALQPGVIIVDQRLSMFFGSRRNLKSVVAANTAALLAWRLRGQGRNVGAIAFNDKKVAQFEPGPSRLHVLLILQAILNQNHGLRPNSGICSNPGMLNEALRRAAKISGSPLVFLITDASGRDQETIRLATNISQCSDLILILIYDPLQARLCNTVRRHHLAVRRFFPDGVPVVPVNTRNDVTYQLRHSPIKTALSSFAKMRHSGATQPLIEAPRS